MNNMGKVEKIVQSAPNRTVDESRLASGLSA